MPKQPTYKIENVKSVTFESFAISDDGEQIVFEVRDKSSNAGHIAVDWLKLSLVVQLFGRAAENASEVRGSLGKSDDFDGSSVSAQTVSGFQVSEYPAKNLKLLSLQSPVGFRCDFAIPTDTVDQRGRSLPRAIAEELLRDANEIQQKPH